MSYSKERMPEGQEGERVRENPHRKYLIQHNLEQIRKVQSGEMTAEQLAELQADRDIELENQADHDGLTGILNYQGFTDAVTQDLAIIYQYDIPAQLALLDGDKLKEINDTKGKLAGNELIKTYARVLNTVASQHSSFPFIVGRFGGDEFALLIIGSQRKETEQVLEEVRSLIPPAAKDSLNDRTLENTVSIGAVTLTANANVMTLLDRADQYLKEAKKTRNTVIFDGRPISGHK